MTGPHILLLSFLVGPAFAILDVLGLSGFWLFTPLIPYAIAVHSVGFTRFFKTRWSSFLSGDVPEHAGVDLFKLNLTTGGICSSMILFVHLPRIFDWW